MSKIKAIAIVFACLTGCKTARVQESDTAASQIRISDVYNRIYSKNLVLEPLKTAEVWAAFNILIDPQVRRSFKKVPDETIVSSLRGSSNQTLQTLNNAKQGLVLPLAIRTTAEGPMIGIAQLIVHEPPKLLTTRLMLQDKVRVSKYATWIELSISISPPSWGKGYGTETLEALIGLGGRKIATPAYWTSVLNDNDRSKNLMEKISFFEFPTIPYENGLPFEGLLEPVDPSTRYYYFYPKQR